MWLIDPKSKEPSVSLTLMIVSFIVFVAAIGLEIGRVTSTLSGSLELFLTCAGLYFSRKMQTKGGLIVEAEEVEKK